MLDIYTFNNVLESFFPNNVEINDGNGNISNRINVIIKIPEFIIANYESGVTHEAKDIYVVSSWYIEKGYVISPVSYDLKMFRSTHTSFEVLNNFSHPHVSGLHNIKQGIGWKSYIDYYNDSLGTYCLGDSSDIRVLMRALYTKQYELGVEELNKFCMLVNIVVRTESTAGVPYKYIKSLNYYKERKRSLDNSVVNNEVANILAHDINIEFLYQNKLVIDERALISEINKIEPLDPSTQVILKDEREWYFESNLLIPDSIETNTGTYFNKKLIVNRITGSVNREEIIKNFNTNKQYSTTIVEKLLEKLKQNLEHYEYDIWSRREDLLASF